MSGHKDDFVSRSSNDALARSFADNGYVVIPGVADPQALADLSASILAEYDAARASGALFSGGGTVSGHLNCFPGSASRFVHEALVERGIIDLVRRLSPTPLRAPNVGCNLNLPGSSLQNEHVDGYASAPFLVANVAAVDTDLENGAMEILERTHLEDYKYWQIMLERPPRLRLSMKQGDVVIRTSTLWHRGMPNSSRRARPMLAFTWEEGGSSKADPYDVHDGRITLLPNRYSTDWAGRLRERAFVAAPRLGTAVRAVQSLLQG